MQAKISEIFLSYQGEGPFAGSRELFVRFYGCNLSCVFCDTMLESYKSFSKEMLLGKILDFDDDYNELVLTGGEPLMHADFLKDFLPLFKKHRGHEVYLETNGTLAGELEKVIGDVDIIAMDFKLPSSTENSREVWLSHEKFIEAAEDKQLIIKVVITDSTTIDDIKMMGNVLAKFNKDFVVILQPVTPTGSHIKEPDGEMLLFFKGYVNKETGKDVSILGQVHKCLGIR
ncbi:MAG: 7-carboxy-7-deazaguanine synthase QueE [Candidatus Omnitrophica bacterium]|nr:7-carboxy-7-deazaguanine synthase QueE [Candidatus Omnitrophota bacterium]